MYVNAARKDSPKKATFDANKVYIAPTLSETKSGFFQTAGGVFLVKLEVQ